MKLLQPADGYHFSMDAVVLARLAELNPGDRVLDLGTGCGVISLILARRRPDITVVGVELQKAQADAAARNVRDHRLTERITILHRDMKTLTPADTSGPVDLAVSNPPHIKAAHGRVSPKHPLALARHEITITLPEILETARRMLGPAGRLVMIYPAGRLADLMTDMRHHGIEPKKILFIYTRFGDCAKRVLVEGIKGGRPGIDIPSPLVLHGPDGACTDAARKLFPPETEFFPAVNDFLFDTPAQNG